MEYGKIIAVTGLPGLFELISSKNDGAIVKSLEDNSTKFVSSRVHNFSHLESIEVFTVRDNVNLTEVFFAMEKESGKVPDGKDAAQLKQYFQKIYPDLDFERVYNSDLKKMAKWFEVLKKNNIEIKLTQQPEEEEEVASAEEVAVEEVKETPKKKAKAATAETKDAKESKEETEEKPKKAAPKKKAEPKAAKADDEDKAPAKKAPAKKAAPKKKS